MKHPRPHSAAGPGRRTAEGDRPPELEELRRHQAELSRSNRALRTLSSCNQALIHASTEAELLVEICRVIVEECGYRMAWVGLAEHDERKSVRPVASWGYAAGYLEKLNITWADEPHGRGPTGTAIRSGRPAVCRDMLTDPRFVPWREEAISRGYASSIVLPLRGDGGVMGALSIYAAEPTAFDEAEEKLLVELADDLAYGLATLRTREAQLQDEARFRLIVEASSNGICVVDKRGRIMLANSRMERLFGYRRDELQGRPVEWLVPERFRADHLHHREEFQAKARVRPMGGSVSYPACRKDGTEFPAEITLHPITMSDGEMTLAIITDVTERLQTIEALRRSESGLKEAQRIARVGSWRLDIATDELIWTEELNRMLGLDPARPAPRYAELACFFLPESWEKLQSALNRTRETGHSYEIELEMRRADGRCGWMLARGEVLRDAQGRVTGLHGTAQDITERKTMEMALHQEQMLFAGLISTVPDHIYFKDRQSRYVRINDLMARDYGLQHAAEAVGRTDADILGAEQGERTYRDEQRIMDTGEPIIGAEQKTVWPDGRVTWASVTKVPLRGADGGITGLIGIARDLTQHKRLETQFHQSQKMEAFGQLAGGIAHDFNNILAVILMQLNLLQLRTDLPPAVAAAVDELERQAQRGAGLTRQILMFSRRQDLETGPVDLNALLQELLKMLGRLLGENIAVELEEAPAPLLIEADAGMVEQVVMNLCVNARDAMTQGGRITIRTSRGEPRCAAAKPGTTYACVAVTDTGCGMDDATKARIFEPFFTTKPMGCGTGLGLATVYGIMQQHRGWVEVDSAPGRGSTFRIYFPLRERPAQDVPAPVAADGHGGNEAILLVEDEASLRHAMAEHLRLAGYRVEAAGDGREALKKWEERGGAFDLLLTDFVMPAGLTGLDLAAELRSRATALRVMVMSGHIPGMPSPANPWPPEITRLNKPFEARTLLKAVRECLDAN